MPRHTIPRLTALALLLCIATTHADGTIACVGNSITAISGYVGLLDRVLGTDTSTINLGNGGKTLLKADYDTYWGTSTFNDVFTANADIITIMLGTNDTRTGTWPNHGHAFKDDLNAMIDTFLTITPTPRIVLVIPTPIFEPACCNAQAYVLADSIKPLIEEVAAERQLPLADCYTPFLGAGMAFDDGVHFFGGPVASGVANTIAAAINGTTHTRAPSIAVHHATPPLQPCTVVRVGSSTGAGHQIPRYLLDGTRAGGHHAANGASVTVPVDTRAPSGP